MDERSSVDGNSGVDAEAIRSLKKFRGVAKREFTKAVNRVTDVIELDEDEAVIRAVKSQLDRAFERFKETKQKMLSDGNENSDVGPDDSCSQVKSVSRSGSYSSKGNRSDITETKFTSLKKT
eukprot:gene8310-9197_t